MNPRIPCWPTCLWSVFFLALSLAGTGNSQTPPPAASPPAASPPAAPKAAATTPVAPKVVAPKQAAPTPATPKTASPKTMAPQPAASTPAGSTRKTEVRDSSKPPIRLIGANFSVQTPRWSEERQRVEGSAWAIYFSKPAAPLDQVGKVLKAGAIQITPAVAGEWRWEKSNLLVFFPSSGWMPPGWYHFAVGEGLLAADCELRKDSDFARGERSPALSAEFVDRNYYIDPATPSLQQLVTTVTFSQPVSLADARAHFSVTSVSGIEIFQPGSEAQLLPDPKNPLRFHLRSPLMKPGEKEDLILFSFKAGLKAKVGGTPSAENFETKLTAYSKHSAFFIQSVGSILSRKSDGEPEQSLFVELSIAAQPAAVASAVEAWKLPPELMNKNGEIILWTKENVTDEVLAKSQKLSLERISNADAPALETAIAFRVPAQPGGRVFVKVPKDTAGPGGFITPEDFRDVKTLPQIPKEVALIGKGGLMALNGERKINVQSRGLDHLRYTVARVQFGQINHLVSQSRGSFESPQFSRDFGFEDISTYQQSVQAIIKSGEYSVNYSAFDFSPLIRAVQPGARPEHGLFQLTLEGVRPRTPEDGVASADSPDRDWVVLPSARRESYGDNYSERYDEDGSRYSSESASNYPRGDKTRDQRFILVTDLGLIMKEAADGSRSIYVQSFSERGPVAEVEISVLSRNGTVLKNATTNGIGKAEIPSLRGLQREQEPVAVVARKGDDLAFIPWAKSDRHLETSRYGVGGVAYSEKSALEASLFTERGIYRPGESINIGGIVRQRDWSGDLTGLPLELVVINAKEEVAGRHPLNLEAGGVFSKTIATTETAPTGPWRVQLERPTAAGPGGEQDSLYLGSILVRVEEFQPDRQKIKATFRPEAAEGWRSPDGLEIAVQLDTLFGIPATERRVAGKLFLSPTTPSFAKWPGWRFGVRDTKRFEIKEIPLSDGTTDEKGHTTLALNLEAHTAPMLLARVELEGFEADGGRGVRTELNTLVSRQAYLIGSKTDRDLDYLDGREPVSVGIVAIGADAQPVAAVGLTRVLVQSKYVSVLTKQENGSLAYESESRDVTLETVPASLAAQEEKLLLPLDKPGEFRYEFRNAAGQTLCAIPFFVAGKGDATRDLERSGELGIEFTDKKWAAGEELEFSLTTPFAGAGLITVERDTVLAQLWFKSDTKSSVQKIRLPENFDGGAYLHVVMARDLDSPDVFMNPLASGIKAIPAARGYREMAVNLKAPDRVRPGERLSIAYTSPKEGHVVIWAVDEGIHLVSNYRAPDPLVDLLPRARLEVETYQLMDLLLPEFSLLRKALAIGGDGDSDNAESPVLNLGINPFKRRRDAPVVYWSGFVPCGPLQQEVFYEVPEYFAGRLKIMAVAVAPDSIGVGQAETVVKGDFVLTSTTPLFVVPGDEFTASVTVANQLEGEAATDQVDLEIVPQGGVEIIGATPTRHAVPVGKEVTVSYRCRATTLLGNAELTFTASSGASRQVSSSSFSVRPGVARAAKVQSGWFRNGSHDLSVNHAMFQEFSEREAIVSTTPLGLAHGLSAYLKEFPHGCTEQIVSRAYPWLVLKDDANFGIEKAEAARLIAETMNQLSKRQGDNGGFGYWGSEAEDGFDYLTVYVGHFLTDCKASGLPVPARLYQATIRRLRYMADAEITDPYTSNGQTYYWRTRWEAEMRASAIYLLTRNEEVTTNYLLKLQDYLDAKVPKGMWHRDSTSAWMASTWRLLQKESAALPLIEAHRAALKRPRPNGWEYGSYYYNSRLADEATAFTILCRHFPEIAKKLSYEEMKPLTQMIEAADFNTLSAAWSIQALKAYSDLAASNGVKAGIALVEGAEVKVLAEPAMGQVQTKVPEGIVRFFFAENSPEGLGAWYQTIEKGFAKTLPDQSSATHLEIRRELVDAEGAQVTQSKLGETLFAKLTIRNVTQTDFAHLAITEMLPGGFEFAPPGEPDSLRPGLATRQGIDYIDIREDRALLYLGLRAGASLTLKYALRPTCAGTFVVPPPYAEDMYDAKVRANGAVGKMIIMARE